MNDAGGINNQPPIAPIENPKAHGKSAQKQQSVTPSPFYQVGKKKVETPPQLEGVAKSASDKTSAKIKAANAFPAASPSPNPAALDAAPALVGKNIKREGEAGSPVKPEFFNFPTPSPAGAPHAPGVNGNGQEGIPDRVMQDPSAPDEQPGAPIQGEVSPEERAAVYKQAALEIQNADMPILEPDPEQPGAPANPKKQPSDDDLLAELAGAAPQEAEIDSQPGAPKNVVYIDPSAPAPEQVEGAAPSDADLLAMLGGAQPSPEGAAPAPSAPARSLMEGLEQSAVQAFKEIGDEINHVANDVQNAVASAGKSISDEGTALLAQLQKLAGGALGSVEQMVQQVEDNVYADVRLILGNIKDFNIMDDPTAIRKFINENSQDHDYTISGQAQPKKLAEMAADDIKKIKHSYDPIRNEFAFYGQPTLAEIAGALRRHPGCRIVIIHRDALETFHDMLSQKLQEVQAPHKKNSSKSRDATRAAPEIAPRIVKNKEAKHTEASEETIPQSPRAIQFREFLKATLHAQLQRGISEQRKEEKERIAELEKREWLEQELNREIIKLDALEFELKKRA